MKTPGEYALVMTMNLYERTKRMPKADFNPEFPTRASLRRARQGQQETVNPEGATDEKSKVVSAPGDEFDSIPESERKEIRKPDSAPSPKPVAPTVPANKKSAPSAKTGAAAAEANRAKNETAAKKVDKATTGSGKPGLEASKPSAKPTAPATAKISAVQESPKAGTAKPVASSPSKSVAATPASNSTTERTATKTSKPNDVDGKGPKVAGDQTKHAQAATSPAPVNTATTTAPAAATAPAKANIPASATIVPDDAAGSAKTDDLSTADGRRQAFREMIPAAGERDTFLRPEDETSFRAERGFRGFLSRMGFNMEPTAQEVEERNWRRTVGTRLNEPKTISVVNGKGGANKTPTAVLLSAVFGRNSGDPVLVWDNNGTRGTLGWRTVQGTHSRHSMDLLADAAKFKDVKVGDPIVHDYVHYQPEDCYSVLRTDPTLLASEQNVNAEDFDAMHEIVSRFFSLTIVDSGNDESAERWMRMIDHTDQLIIASTTVEEHAEAGALLLEALAKRGGHYAELAKNAVVIVSQHQPQGNSDQLNRIAHGFRRLASSVVTVPYDAALVKGQIRFDGMRPATRRAWLHATAAVATALHN